MPAGTLFLINKTLKSGQLVDANGRIVEVAPQPRFYADGSVSLMKAPELSPGIVCLTETITAQAVRDGGLARVLPAWTASRVMTTILTPHKRAQLPAVRAVTDCLTLNMAGVNSAAP